MKKILIFTFILFATIAKSQYIVDDAFKKATKALANIANSGTIGTAAATVDRYSSFTINQTTSGRTFTLPNPTRTISGDDVTIRNNGSVSFTMYGFTVDPDDEIHLTWKGSWKIVGAWQTLSIVGDQLSIQNGNTVTLPAGGGGGVTTNVLSLSGNTMTSNVEGISDTSLVIGEFNLSSSGNTLTGEVNNVTDTTTIINSNSLSYATGSGILTSYINGISDTTLITASGSAIDTTYFIHQNGNTYGAPVRIGTNDNFNLWFETNDQVVAYLTTAGALNIGASQSVAITNQFIYPELDYTIQNNGDREIILYSNRSTPTEESYFRVKSDSITSITDQFRVNADTLNLNIAGSHGTNGQVLMSDGYLATWQTLAGGGVSSNSLNLSGNTMTSTINGGFTDTSLVIGVVNANLAGNQITVNVNNVTDTTLVIGSNDLSSSVNTMTSNVNGVSDNATIINSNSNSLSGNVITGSVNGISDTVLVIGSNTVGLSGNSITSQVNGVSDTTLVIGTNSLGLSGNELTISTNGVSDTSLVIGEVDLSSSGNTMTAEVNNITDTAPIINTNTLTFSSDSLKSTVNGLNSNAIYLGGFTNTDNQYIDSLDLSSGNDSIRISLFGDNVTKKTLYLPYLLSEVDGSVINEIQTLSINGGTINLSLGGGSVGIPDSSITNEIQQIDTFSTSVNTISASLSSDGVAAKTASIINSNALSSATNTMTSTVNGVANSGTGTIINSNALSYSTVDGIITSSLNGISDTTAIPYSGASANGILSSTDWNTFNNKLSAEVDGSTTNEIQTIDTFSTSVNTLSASLSSDGQAAKTATIINSNTVNLAGNEITSAVNGISDTTLVIGSVSNTSSTNSLSTTVNGVTGSTVNIINSNSLSYGTVDGILTSNINGVSDTTKVTGLTVANGGTGASTLTGVVIGNGASAMTATTTSSGISGQISDETGTGVMVFGTAPTFTTSITTPLINGGTATTDSIIFKPTTANAVDAQGAFVFNGDNNGGTNLMTIRNNGYVGIGTTAPTFYLEILKNQNAETSMSVTNTTDGTTSTAGIRLSGVRNKSSFIGEIAPGNTGGYAVWDSCFIIEPNNTAGHAFIVSVPSTSGYYSLFTGGRAVGNERIKVNSSGVIARSCGVFAAAGDATYNEIVLRKAITGTAASELFIDGSSLQAIIPATNTGWNVDISLVAICTATGNGTTTLGATFNAKRYCAITRIGSTTALTSTVETIGTDKAGTGMSTSATTITADDATEALKITFTPPSTAGSTTTFRVVATYRIVQVQY